MITSRSVNMVRHPRGSYIVIPFAVSGVATSENKVVLIGAVIHKQESRHKVQRPSYERFLEGCSSPFMRLAEHVTARRAWCKQCLPGWCKPDVLRPGIVGMRGSMVIRLRPCTSPPPVGRVTCSGAMPAIVEQVLVLLRSCQKFLLVFD